MKMAANEESEKLLAHSEVKKVLEEALEKPNVIYTGPEDDGFSPRPHQLDPSGEEDETEKDPLHSLSFEKRATLDHVGNFTRITGSKVGKMVKELSKIDRVSEVHAYKIAELMPRDETELRPVFAKDRFTLTPEELKQILDIIDTHRD
jgi:DNA-directed RNA polymerase subunit F